MLCLKHQKTYILLFHFEWISNEYPISRPKLIKIRVKYLRRDSYKMPLQFWPRSLMRSSSLGEMCPNTKLILVRNFPVVTLNTEIYKVNLRSQSEYRKIRTRNNSVFRHFSCSEETTRKLWKVAAAKSSFRSVYIIDVTCFN